MCKEYSGIFASVTPEAWVGSDRLGDAARGVRLTNARRQSVAAVVLGARVSKDGSPCPAFQRRLNAAATLWREGHVLRVCVVGGVLWGEHVESVAGKSYLARKGVPAEAVCVDAWSTSTRGNARTAFALLGDVPIVVVTDGYHMPRALRCFGRWFRSVARCPVRSPWKGRARVREVLAWVAELCRASDGSNMLPPPAWSARGMLAREMELCAGVRRVVFQLGQSVPVEIERDGRDAEAHHWVLRKGPVVVGTARARIGGDGVAKVERVAVLGCFRGEGAGRLLMGAVHEGLVARGVQEAKLHAQQDVIGFYKALGYVPEGEVFYEADIPHVAMRSRLMGSVHLR